MEQKPVRIYYVYMGSEDKQQIVEISADEMSKESGAFGRDTWIFKRNGEIVGEFDSAKAVGWRSREPDDFSVLTA